MPILSTNKPLLKKIAVRFIIFFTGILLPVYVFCFSGALAPESKEAADYNWLSLLLYTKLVFIPVVLWATISFFFTNVVVIHEDKFKKIRVFGLYAGAITAGMSLLFLLTNPDNGSVWYIFLVCLFNLLPYFFIRQLIRWQDNKTIGIKDKIRINWLQVSIFLGVLIFIATILILIFSNFAYVSYSGNNIIEIIALINGSIFMIAAMISPGLVIAWYAHSANKLNKSEIPTKKVLTVDSLIHAPFVLAAIIWAENMYNSLPEQKSDCFIVTATCRTNQRYISHTQLLDSNEKIPTQLLYMKSFEFLWKNTFPRSHTQFRRLYDIIGPKIASQINKHPIRAVICYFFLKPIEWFFRGVILLVVTIKKYGNSK